MQKEAEILKQYNAALCASYCAKTGKSLDEMLRLMDRETWLTARQCVEMGFVDRIMDTKAEGLKRTAGINGIRLTEADMELYEKAMAEKGTRKDTIIKDLDSYGV